MKENILFQVQPAHGIHEVGEFRSVTQDVDPEIARERPRKSLCGLNENVRAFGPFESSHEQKIPHFTVHVLVARTYGLEVQSADIDGLRQEEGAPPEASGVSEGIEFDTEIEIGSGCEELEGVTMFIRHPLKGRMQDPCYRRSSRRARQRRGFMGCRIVRNDGQGFYPFEASDSLFQCDHTSAGRPSIIIRDTQG